MVNYPKKANEIGIAEYEAENFKLQVTPPFCHTILEKTFGALPYE